MPIHVVDMQRICSAALLAVFAIAYPTISCAGIGEWFESPASAQKGVAWNHARRFAAMLDHATCELVSRNREGYSEVRLRHHQRYIRMPNCIIGEVAMAAGPRVRLPAGRALVVASDASGNEEPTNIEELQGVHYAPEG
jgi:hypothetical protein